MKADIIEAIKRSGAVPSMPQVVTRFLEIIQQPDFNYEDLTSVLSTDPGTTAEILRLSNSSLFGVSRKITSLKQAMTLLGPRRVRSLVLGRYMVEAISDKAMGALDPSYYWRRSLTCSVLAARFADVLAPQLREDVFIAALLADIGVTILAQEVGDKYAPITELYKPHGEVNIAQAELDAVGVTHADISAIVLEYWQLPSMICEAVAQHQSDVAATTDAVQLARMISSSDKISKLLCESPEMEQLAQRCHAAMEFVNLDLSVLLEMLPKVEQDVTELAEMLRVDVIPSSVYQLIAKAIQGQLTASAPL